MTASPADMSLPPTKLANFNGDAAGNPLAALFAAAAASSMQRQKASAATPKSAPQIKPTISALISSTKSKQRSSGTTSLGAATTTPTAATTKVAPPAAKTKATIRESELSAANLITSLLNGTTKTSLSSPRFASASSLPLTKTTATFTTTTAIKSQPIQKEQPASPPMKASTIATVAKHKTSLLNPPQKQAASDTMTGTVELRNLESWHDEDEVKMDDDCYEELVDSNNTNGWSADEMFKYNEKRHKVMSSYSEKTLSDKYTTPLSRNKSKTTARMATKLAKEIEDRVEAEGRVTPESSDDDELFEKERRQRIQKKQAAGSIKTPATASLSSSPTMNNTSNIITKSLASSSRNILRTCLT